MTKKEAKNRCEIWKKRLKRLRNEISQMLIARHVFWGVQDIIRKNPKIQRGNLFYGWLGGAYVTDLLIKIRRQLGPSRSSGYAPRKDDISFASLLYEIKQNPEILS